MSEGLAQFYSQQNQEIADMLLMERHIHNVTADVREEKLGDPVANYHLVSCHVVKVNECNRRSLCIRLYCHWKRT